MIDEGVSVGLVAKDKLVAETLRIVNALVFMPSEKCLQIAHESVGGRCEFGVTREGQHPLLARGLIEAVFGSAGVEKGGDRGNPSPVRNSGYQ